MSAAARGARVAAAGPVAAVAGLLLGLCLPARADEAVAGPAAPSAEARIEPGELAQRVAALDPRDPAWGPLALRLGRLLVHTGDRLHGLDLLSQVAQTGPGGSADEARTLWTLLQPAQVKPGLVGVLLPQTGDLKGFSEAVLDAIAMQIKSTGTAITLSVKDTKNDPDGAARAIEELAREGAIAAIGPIGLAESPAAAVRAQQLGLPLLSLSRAEGITAVGPWVFRNMLTNSVQAKAVAEFAMKKLSAKSFGVLQPDSAYGDELTRFFWDALDAGGAEVRAYERYPRQTTTFKPYIAKMVGRFNLGERGEYLEEERKIIEQITDPYRRRKAIGQLKSSTSPLVEFDALFIPDGARTVRLIAPAIAAEDVVTSCDERELTLIRRTSKHGEVRPVQLLGTNLWDSPDLLDERMGAARYVQCAVFADGFFPHSARPETRKFVELMQDVYNRVPGFLEAHAYDAAGLLKQLLELKKPQSREELRGLLLGMEKPYPGAAGDLSFAPDGEAKKTLFWLVVHKGAFFEFDPDGPAPIEQAQAAAKESGKDAGRPARDKAGDKGAEKPGTRAQPPVGATGLADPAGGARNAGKP